MSGEPLADSSNEQFYWSGSIYEPPKIDIIAGVIRQDPVSDVLEIESFRAEGLKAKLKSVKMGSGQAIRFTAADLTADFAQISSANVKGTIEMRAGTMAGAVQGADASIVGSVNIAAFTANIDHGPILAPSGSGKILTTALDLTQDSVLEIRESCDGQADFQGIPIRTHLQAGAVGLNYVITNGRISGKGSALLSSASMKDRGQYECRLALIDWTILKEVRVKYNYPCPTWSKPFRFCDGWTILVPALRVGVDRLIRVRHFQADGFFTLVSLNLYEDGLPIRLTPTPTRGSVGYGCSGPRGSAFSAVFAGISACFPGRRGVCCVS